MQQPAPAHLGARPVLPVPAPLPPHPSPQNNPAVVTPSSACGKEESVGLSTEHISLFVHSGKQPIRSVLGISPPTSAFTEVLHMVFSPVLDYFGPAIIL